MVSSAFVPTTPLRLSVSRHVTTSNRRTVNMSVRKPAARLAAIPATLMTALPALADGTGEGLGIDNALLFLPLIVIPGAFLALFLQFGSGQDNEDFLGEYATNVAIKLYAIEGL